MSTAVTRDAGRVAYSGDILPAAERARRVRRFGWWFYTEHWLRTLRSYGLIVLLESTVAPMLYLVAMGVGLGALVNKGVGSVDSVPYVQFVAPALVVSMGLQAAMGESTYTVMGGFKWHRTFLGAQCSPIQPAQIATGHLVGASLRFLGQSVLFWLVMLLFGATHSVASVLLPFIATLGALAFAAPVTAYSATLENEGLQFNLLQRFIVNPMTLFAGTFYPLSSMPIFLQWIGWISPIWHATQLARIASYGAREPLWLIAIHVAYLVALTVVGWLLARRNFTRRLTK